MRKTFATAVAAASLLLAGGAAVHAADPVVIPQEPDAVNGVRIGYLDCTIGGGAGYVLGSAKEVNCVFRTAMDSEPSDHYAGAIRKFGVDVGFTTQGRLIWAVFAPTAGYHHGSLSGIYQGATAEATLGAGVGANILIGGTTGSIHLQTVSVTGQLGLNVAATGTSVTLTSVN
ncbi:DUF992 domain-containing protein [Sinorhizobium sp. BG8]|uniref:DUF992 domain-containing protein n=1 Tax=Sinorhizobium sp. BG8 TaxID=2613773 RepID=UPI00193CFC90|nr:DUF992 domain-containing protein [Sinorhizobium sp. BG8]QRM57381.1 DUF992 domain-containing protein [Sinorhizobium sp. BG8]